MQLRYAERFLLQFRAREIILKALASPDSALHFVPELRNFHHNLGFAQDFLGGLTGHMCERRQCCPCPLPDQQKCVVYILSHKTGSVNRIFPFEPLRELEKLRESSLTTAPYALLLTLVLFGQPASSGAGFN